MGLVFRHVAVDINPGGVPFSYTQIASAVTNRYIGIATVERSIQRYVNTLGDWLMYTHVHVSQFCIHSLTGRMRRIWILVAMLCITLVRVGTRVVCTVTSSSTHGPHTTASTQQQALSSRQAKASEYEQVGAITAVAGRVIVKVWVIVQYTQPCTLIHHLAHPTSFTPSGAACPITKSHQMIWGWHCTAPSVMACMYTPSRTACPCRTRLASCPPWLV